MPPRSPKATRKRPLKDQLDDALEVHAGEPPSPLKDMLAERALELAAQISPGTLTAVRLLL